MKSLPRLYQELHHLQIDMNHLLEEGPILQGVRLEFTPAGGTASEDAKLSCKYARLRAGRGNVLANGKKSQYVKLNQIVYYQDAIARGKRLTHLQRKISQVKRQIQKGEAIATELGLPLPEFAAQDQGS